MKTLIIFFCFVFAFCINISITSKSQVDLNDSLALVDLYNSTNGPSWYNHNNWLNGPVNTWYGLSLSYDIIKAHGGEIKVETKDGEGCKFIIYLPV